jgi:hypothetical protein
MALFPIYICLQKSVKCLKLIFFWINYREIVIHVLYGGWSVDWPSWCSYTELYDEKQHMTEGCNDFSFQLNVYVPSSRRALCRHTDITLDYGHYTSVVVFRCEIFQFINYNFCSFTIRSFSQSQRNSMFVLPFFIRRGLLRTP